MPPSTTNPRITTQVNGADTRVSLIGDWTTQDDGGVGASMAALFDRKELRVTEFDSSRLARWDSSLLVYLSAVRHTAAPRSIRVDDSGIPIAARRPHYALAGCVRAAPPHLRQAHLISAPYQLSEFQPVIQRLIVANSTTSGIG